MADASLSAWARLHWAVRIGIVLLLAVLAALAVTVGPRLGIRADVREYIIKVTSSEVPTPKNPVWKQSDAHLFAIDTAEGNTLAIGRSELAGRQLQSSPYLSTFFYCWMVAKERVWLPGDVDRLKTCERMRYVLVYDLDFRALSTPSLATRRVLVDVVLLEMIDMSVVAAGQVAFSVPPSGTQLAPYAPETMRFKRALTDWMRDNPTSR